MVRNIRPPLLLSALHSAIPDRLRAPRCLGVGVCTPRLEKVGAVKSLPAWKSLAVRVGIGELDLADAEVIESAMRLSD